MTTEEIKTFQLAVGTAGWNLNLDRFAEAVGQSPEHTHTQELFKDFSALSRSIARFDPETMQKILTAGASKPTA